MKKAKLYKIPAKFSGRCTDCGERIRKGRRIVWDSRTHAIYHVLCWEGKHGEVPDREDAWTGMRGLASPEDAPSARSGDTRSIADTELHHMISERERSHGSSLDHGGE